MSEVVDKLLEYALQEAPKIQRPLGRSQGYTEIARVFLKSGRKSRSMECLQTALQSAGSLKPEEKSRQLAEIAVVYASAGDRVQAADLFKRAVLLAQAAETPAQQSGALLQIASEYAAADMADDAEVVLSRLHDLVTNPESGIDTACELVDIASIYADIGQMDKSGETAEEAIQVSKKLEDNWIRAERFLAVAQVYSDIDNMEKARQVLEEALHTVDRIDPAGKPYFLIRMTDIWTDLEDQPQAEEILSTALGIVNEEEAAFPRSGDLIEIARRLADLGKNSYAGEVLDRAQASAEEIEDNKDKIARFIEIAGLRDELGTSGDALEQANRAFHLCSRLTDNRTLLHMLGNLALLYSGLKKKEKADEAVSWIRKTVQETNVRTTGLGTPAEDLAAAGELIQSLRLGALIHEPEIKVYILARVSQSLIESGREPGEELLQVVRETISAI